MSRIIIVTKHAGGVCSIRNGSDESRRRGFFNERETSTRRRRTEKCYENSRKPGRTLYIGASVDFSRPTYSCVARGPIRKRSVEVVLLTSPLTGERKTPFHPIRVERSLRFRTLYGTGSRRRIYRRIRSAARE